jgi:hypothetical protein
VSCGFQSTTSMASQSRRVWCEGSMYVYVCVKMHTWLDAASTSACPHGVKKASGRAISTEALRRAEKTSTVMRNSPDHGCTWQNVSEGQRQTKQANTRQDKLSSAEPQRRRVKSGALDSASLGSRPPERTRSRIWLCCFCLHSIA